MRLQSLFIALALIGLSGCINPFGSSQVASPNTASGGQGSNTVSVSGPGVSATVTVPAMPSARALPATSNSISTWVSEMTPNGGWIVVEGQCTIPMGNCAQLVKMDAEGNQLGSHDFNGGIWAGGILDVTTVGDKTYVAGQWTEIDGVLNKKGLARVLSNGDLDTTYDPQFPILSDQGRQNSIAVVAGVPGSDQIYIGGDVGGDMPANAAPHYLARLNSDGTVDQTFGWNNSAGAWLNISGAVMDLALETSGNILIIGLFPSINGNGASAIGRITPDGVHDVTYASTGTGNGFAGNVWFPGFFLDRATDKLYVGSSLGSLGSYNGVPAENLIRLNADGTLDPAFITGTGFHSAGGSVSIRSVISVGDGSGDLLVGGLFDYYQGQAATNLVRISSTGAFVSAIHTGAASDSGNGDKIWSIERISTKKFLVTGKFASCLGADVSNAAIITFP